MSDLVDMERRVPRLAVLSAAVRTFIGAPFTESLARETGPRWLPDAPASGRLPNPRKPMKWANDPAAPSDVSRRSYGCAEYREPWRQLIFGGHP
jgi:hypothetical protein